MEKALNLSAFLFSFLKHGEPPHISILQSEGLMYPSSNNINNNTLWKECFYER